MTDTPVAVEIGMTEPIEEARAELGRILVEHRQGIDAARTFNRLTDAGVEEYSGIVRLAEVIKQHFGVDENEFPNAHAFLYEIGDEHNEPDHSLSGFIAQEGDKKGQIIAARGLLLRVNCQGTIFACFILDPGSSREFYDAKTQKEKIEYMQRYINRNNAPPRNHYGEIIRDPDFLAIAGNVNEDPNSPYQVEQIIPYIPRPILAAV